MACSQYIATTQTTNAARVSRLLIDPCTDLFRDILRSHITEIQFPSILEKEKKKLLPILNKAQKEILFPKSGNFIGTFGAFDLSLLYVLLRNISGIKPHQNGWAKSPHSLDRSLSANIDRLREIRNTYCGHATSVTLSDAEFQKLWQNLTVIISELEGSLPGGCTTYTDAAQTIKTDTMDPEQEKKFLDMIAQQHQTTEDLKEKLLHIEGTAIEWKKEQINQSTKLDRLMSDIIKQGKKRKAEEVKQEQERKRMKFAQIKQRNEIKKLKDEQNRKMTELKSEQVIRKSELSGISANLARIEKQTDFERINIIENTLAVLKAQKLKKVNIRTTGAQITIDKVKENHVVILTGKAGSGKTTTAYQVMCEMSDPSIDPTYTPVIIKSPEQWDKVVNPSQRYIVYLDDIFGATNFDSGAVEKWKNQLETICSCAKTWNVLVLIGLRKHILDEARKCYLPAIFDGRNEVDLSLKDNLNMKDKRTIFEAYYENCSFIDSQLSGNIFYLNKKQNESTAKDRLLTYEKEEILSSNPYYGFPLTCFQFFTRPEFFQLGTSYFQRPDERIFKAIEDMRRAKGKKIGEKIKYCVLCYVFIKGNIVSNKVSEKLLKNICKILRIFDILEIDIKDAVNDLDGVYLSQSTTKDTYVFSHETILEALMVSFGQLAPEFVIETCNKEKLHELIRTESYEAKSGEIVLKIPRRLYKTLVQKLVSLNGVNKEDKYSTFWEVAKIMDHPACLDPVFASVFCDCDISDPFYSKLCHMLSITLLFTRFLFRSIVLMGELLERVGSPQAAPVKQKSKGKVRIQIWHIRNLLENFYLFSDDERVLRCILPYICKNRNLHGLINTKVSTLNIFHYCVLHGWEDFVDMILEVHTPTKTLDNWSCVHLAAYAGRALLLRKLINIGHDVKEKTPEGFSALQSALLGLRYGHHQVFSSSSNINSLHNRFYAFHRGVSFPESNDFKNVMKALLAKNTEIQIPDLSKAVDEHDNCIIHYLVIHDYIDVLKYLLNYDKEFVFQRNNSCLPTALHVAVYLGRPEMVRKLWALGVRPSSNDLSLRETYYNGEVFFNKLIFNDKLANGNYQFAFENDDHTQMLWNDGTRNVYDILIKAIRKVKVNFGSFDEYQRVRDFLNMEFEDETDEDDEEEGSLQCLVS